MTTDNALLGERIRSLRLSRGMTQKALAGDTITRNMLSLIESGAATPSIYTLTELAKRLEVPAGYFFAADDEELAYFLKKKCVPALRRLYKAGEYQSCLDLCATLSHPDNEIHTLSAACYLALAGDALRRSSLATASHFLNAAASAAAGIVYDAAVITDTVAYLRLLMESIGEHTIPAALSTPDSFPRMQVSLSFVAYIAALRLLQTEDAEGAEALCRSGMITDEFHLAFLRAKICMVKHDTENAAPVFRRLISAQSPGFFTQFHLLDALESCASAAGDFRSAYQFSTQKVQLLEQFAK